MYFDSTYVLVLIGMAIVMFAQHRVTSTFAQFSSVETSKRITGRQAAEAILAYSNIHDVTVEHVRGNLTDHYDPRNKVLRLSDATYDSDSIAAVAVAAHECGHAVQDAQNYHFLKVRSFLAPITQIGSTIAMPMIFLGLILSWMGLVQLGILAFSLVLVFQIVTLPVEFDASKRALAILEEGGFILANETPSAKKVLNAAAFTYIAATLSTALQLLRLILISNRRRN
ncbi:peptidase [Aerococcaceae bacterium DSM 109653]|uniref:Peptidase n=1 Tax=Fundicoccus ignavus TaxID=2664442 RepID=A0A6I2GYY6_9LACT|nr:zinc metallopeptidase [Fundicoccus ignavus]MRI82508.1 peptidase [Fundicoccus ignavus]MRI85653.1 peptidase [Fundicoccus ignavus]